MKTQNLIAIIAISVMFLTAIPLTSCTKGGSIDSTPVASLDLEKYLGKWYEIARYNHPFEKGLDNVTAEYSIREDGMVKVLNSGWKEGKFQTAEGKAKLAAEAKGSAWLKVSFFLFFYGDYKVMMTDDNYSFALIGSKTDKYLWILSRTPQLPEETLASILDEAKSRGYDTDKLIWVDQGKNMDK